MFRTFISAHCGLLCAAVLCCCALCACLDDKDVCSNIEVSTIDATMIYDYIAKGGNSGISSADVDVNGDGRVNTADVVALYTYVKGDAPLVSYFVNKASILSEKTGSLCIAKNSVKNNKTIEFRAIVDSFVSDAVLTIGHGSAGDYAASWVDITPTQIVAHTYLNADKTVVYEHGLQLAQEVCVSISKRLTGASATVVIESNGQKFEKNISWTGDNGTTGGIYAKVRGVVMNDAKIYWSCSSLHSNVWLFGDSYFALDNSARWTSYLVRDGYGDFLQNAFPGAKSAEILQDFKTLLSVGKPEVAVWCLGMNNKDNASDTKTADKPNSEWLKATREFVSLCQQHDIIPILATIPTVIGGGGISCFRYHGAKNEWIKASGYRYVDFAEAVGADDATGYWYGEGTPDDYLEGNAVSATRVHPTVAGAKALYAQFQKDCADLLK